MSDFYLSILKLPTYCSSVVLDQILSGAVHSSDYGLGFSCRLLVFMQQGLLTCLKSDFLIFFQPKAATVCVYIYIYFLKISTSVFVRSKDAFVVIKMWLYLFTFSVILTIPKKSNLSVNGFEEQVNMANFNTVFLLIVMQLLFLQNKHNGHEDSQ